MMNEDSEMTPELSNSVHQRIRQIVKQNPSLVDKHTAELETVLTTLATLPFKDEIQQATLLEHVQRLQGNHIIQIFNCGVSPLHKSFAESSAEFVEEVRKLFEMCFFYCYTTDVSKRVSFECYVRALAFCFPSEPNQCLSTAVVSRLLELVQIIQKGKLVANFGFVQIYPGTNHFFGELLQIFESRRHEDYLVEIIDQTARLASVDAEHAIKDISLQSEHVISPVFVSTWMKVLKLTHVSNGFAFALAKVNSPSCTADQSVLDLMPVSARHTVPSQTINLSWPTTVCYFVSVLEEMKQNGSEVSLSNDKERLDIFFNYLNHFCNHRNVTATSLKLLAATSITNEVLREVLDQFLYKERVAIDFRKEAFELVFEVLSLHPDGKLVKKVLKFWREAISDEPGYQTLACLLALFVVESTRKEERAEKILDFLEEIPRPLFLLISFWQFLWWFIKTFPATFNQRRQEILAFINKAVAVQVPVEQGQTCVIRETLQFLQWVCQQSCPEETKSEMICLLVCSSGEAESLKWMFAINRVIKLLGLCPRLQFSTKKQIVRQLNYLAPFLKEQEKNVLTNSVENIASNQTLGFMDEILCEFLDFMECFVDHQKPKTIPEDILTLLSLLSKVSISVERRRKLMQLSKKSVEGLQSGLRILQLIQKYRGVLQERANEYFDLLFAAIVETLKEDGDLCEQLCNQHPRHFPSIDVLKVWTFAVTGLLSLGLFKEEIDSRCCCPVLQQAYGFSPFETLQLLFQVRTTAVKLAHLSRRQIEASSSSNALHTSQESSIGETDLLKKFVESMTMNLFTPALLSWEQLLLVKKVCDVVLSTPHILTTATFRNALINCIPWDLSISSNNEGIHWEFYRIVDLLDNPKVLKQLSRIPLDGMPGNSLCSLLSTKMSNSFSCVNVVDIFLFIGSLQDLDQAFFDHLLPFVKMAIQVSTSGEDVLELLKELAHVLCNIRSEMIHLTMLNFAYFIENPVNKQERDRFLSEVAMRWKLSPNRRIFSFLEVPQLLWKAYNAANTPAKRGELIDRVQEILKKRNKVPEDCVMSVHRWFRIFGGMRPRDYENIRKRIACCELEWLVFHSSLSNKAAALAFDLSCSFRLLRPRHSLRCLTFSDVQIEDGIFKFVLPRKNETASDSGSTSSVAVTSTGNDVSPTTEPHQPILTPVLIAQKVIHHLTRVLDQEEDPTENAFSLWELVVCNPRELSCDSYSKCESNCSFLDDRVNAFLSILAEASSIEMMFHWARLDQHHVYQCSEVIMKACKCNEDEIDKEALLKLQTGISITLEKMRLIKPSLPWKKSYTAPCFRSLKAELKHLGDMLESRLPIEVTMKVLDFYQINIQAGIAVGEIVSLWSCKQEALALVENLQSFCERNQGSPSILKAAQSEFVWKLLKAFGRFCKDSCKDLISWFKELFVLHDPEDTRGFNRLPKWRETMIADGFPARVIDSWCTAFLMTPLEDLTSRDVDAIVDLDSRSFQIVTSTSQIIKRVIFPEDGFQVTKGEGIKERPIKERIRLARLLSEFINILKHRKPEESPKDAVVRDIVVDACDELCKSHENENRRKNDLYKIRDQKLKALFTEIFGKRRKSEDGEVSIHDCGMTHQAGEEEPRVAASVGRQTSYLHENLPSVLSHKDVYESLLVLLRRWLSGIVTKPTLASRTLEILQLLFSVHSSKKGPALLDELHDIIQTRILSLERNQSLMAQLQVSGYNQRGQNIPDLWSSRTMELPCFLSKRESANSRLFTKKLVEVLRPLWNEWKDILSSVQKESIKVGDDDVRTNDLFGVQASLEEMEKQAAAVKEVVKQINPEDFNRRVQHLIREEQRHRARIEKFYKSIKSQSQTCGREKDELKKFVAVWENRFLKQVKMCSERIPGCYAPNGLHSEKPVVCALSVDNRILTVFKDEKGRREEIENVEVKLFEAGMYVYGLHTSGHDYVTDELWAAFYKMLLENRLVSSIVLSNESPGFDWIKEFVQPATSHPCPLRWELHNGIVPPEEDYFDYIPIRAALSPDFQFLTLTRENVSSFQFSDLKDVNIVQEKEKQTREMAGKAIQQLQHELHVLHGQNEPIKRAMAGKLTFAVKETVKRLVDGVQPTVGSVKMLIDMERLAFTQRNKGSGNENVGHPEVERTEEKREQYAAAVHRACEHVWSIPP